jgi:histidinol phosphatase-like PHP family hydrolase
MAFLYETHLHTSQASACALSTGAEQAVAYAKRGYAGIIVTDHFFEGNTSVPFHLPWAQRINMFVSGYMDAKAAGDTCGLDVFLGWEYYADGKEFLTYGLGIGFLYDHPELEHMSLRDYSNLVRVSGGYLAQAHPFRQASYMKGGGPAKPSLLGGVEVYNAHNREESFNDEALAFALKHKLPMQAGTDSHSAEQGFTSGVILKQRARDIFDIINAIKSNEAQLITPK